MMLPVDGNQWQPNWTDLRSAARRMIICLIIVLPVQRVPADEARNWQELREQMVRTVLQGSGIQNERVLHAMRETPRHLFVPRHLRDSAYQDMALPIGQSQTISSPFIVAYMTECLDPQVDDRVLEIGTGSGYQAAVLSPLVREVYTIEIVPSLAQQAQKLLRQLKLNNVTVRVGDGFQGWAEHAPFQKIIVTCSPENVPQPLIDQLADEGRMVVPVGERYQQTMHLFRKTKGQLKSEAERPTLFVPMTGRAETQRSVQPDPAHPRLVNGDFELAADGDGNIAGWYYQRQAELVRESDAPQGQQYVRFQSKIHGLESHLLQGLAVDGRRVTELRVHCRARTSIESPLPEPNSGPRLAVTFYDQDRRELATRWLGPWLRATQWIETTESLRVPTGAREMIVRLGLFGAHGIAEFDDITIEPGH